MRKKAKIRATDDADQGLRGTATGVPIAAIQFSEFNVRKDFSVKEIEALAETMRSHGLLEPVIVRPVAQRGKGAKEGYELVAGERRLQAANWLDWTTIPAVVRELSDLEAREICVLENLQRKDLNTIEEARAFEMLLVGVEGDRDTTTQTELAERLGVSQGHVANRLRLLKLPAKIQKRVISQEIPPTHAREIVPFVEYPKIIDEIEEIVASVVKRGNSLGNVEEFKDEIVDQALFDTTKPMIGDIYGHLGPMAIFKPTDQQRKQLGIVKAGDNGVERATNTKLWEKLQAEHVAKLEKKGGKKGKEAKGEKEGKEKKLTAAQQKRLAEEERLRTKERHEQFKQRLSQWKTNWLRYLIAEQIKECDEAVLVRLLMLFVYGPSRYAEIRDAYKARKLRIRNTYDTQCVWAALASVENAEHLDELVRAFLRRCFWSDKDGPTGNLIPGTVRLIVEYMCIDLAAEWKKNQAGPLSEAYWNLHGKEQLAEVAKQQKLPAENTKAKLVLALRNCKTPLPAEIKKAKGG